MKKIVLIPIRHRGNLQIAIHFAFSNEVKEHLLKLKNVKWSRTNKMFYIPFSSENKRKIYQHLNSKGWFVDYSQLQYFPEESCPRDRLRDQFSARQKKIFQEYIAYLQGRRLSASTVRTYSGFIEIFMEFIGNRALSEIGNRDIERFMEQKVVVRNYSISTHRQITSALKQFSSLYPETCIDPQKIYQPPKDRYLPGVLSKEEVIALLQATRNLKHRAALAMMYAGGLRIGELLNLKLKDIDIQRRQIFIKKSKGRKDRMVVLAESI